MSKSQAKAEGEAQEKMPEPRLCPQQEAGLSKSQSSNSTAGISGIKSLEHGPARAVLSTAEVLSVRC